MAVLSVQLGERVVGGGGGGQGCLGQSCCNHRGLLYALGCHCNSRAAAFACYFAGGGLCSALSDQLVGG